MTTLDLPQNLWLEVWALGLYITTVDSKVSQFDFVPSIISIKACFGNISKLHSPLSKLTCQTRDPGWGMSFIHCECWKTSAGSIGVLYSCSGWCLLLRFCCITTLLVRGVGTLLVILRSILQPIAKCAREVEVVYWDCSCGLLIWRFICTTWFAMFPWSQFEGYTTGSVSNGSG